MREIYFSLPLRILHHIKFISVHHGRTSICILPFKFSSVIGMDMAVEKNFGWYLSIRVRNALKPR